MSVAVRFVSTEVGGDGLLEVMAQTGAHHSIFCPLQILLCGFFFRGFLPLCTYIYIFIYIYMCLYMSKYKHRYVYVYVYIYIYIVNVHVYMCMYLYIDISLYIFIYIFKDTNSCTCSWYVLVNQRPLLHRRQFHLALILQTPAS